MPQSNSESAGTQANVGAARYPEMQHPLDRALYHPLAARLARILAPTFVSANMVSVAGGLIVVLGAIVYVQPSWPLAALLGLLIHMSWHVLDGADGDLARVRGTAGRTGEIVDGLCDYASHIALYLILAGASFATIGWVAWAMAVAAGGSRIVQSNFHEVRRRQYLYWVHGKPWLGVEQDELAPSGFGWARTAYLDLARLFSPAETDIDRAAREQDVRGRIAQVLQDEGPGALAGSSLLGANSRTLVLGASMLAGSPLWFFVYEAIVLNGVLAAAIRRSRKTLARLRSSIQMTPRTLR